MGTWRGEPRLYQPPGVTNSRSMKRRATESAAWKGLSNGPSKLLQLHDRPVDLRTCAERVTGIEPAWPAWEAWLSHRRTDGRARPRPCGAAGRPGVRGAGGHGDRRRSRPRRLAREERVAQRETPRQPATIAPRALPRGALSRARPLRPLYCSPGCRVRLPRRAPTRVAVAHPAHRTPRPATRRSSPASARGG